MRILGIDPGLNGGIALIDQETKSISAIRTPIYQFKKGGKNKRFLNALEIIKQIMDNLVDDIKTVHTECAKTIAKYLALKYGLFVGISAGANVFASFQWLRDNNKEHAVTILCDRGERYLSCL